MYICSQFVGCIRWRGSPNWCAWQMTIALRYVNLELLTWLRVNASGSRQELGTLFGGSKKRRGWVMGDKLWSACAFKSCYFDASWVLQHLSRSNTTSSGHQLHTRTLTKSPQRVCPAANLPHPTARARNANVFSSADRFSDMRNGAPAVFAAARCVAWGYAICHMRLYLWNSLLGVNPAGSQEHLVLGNGRCGFIFKVQCLGGALSASSLRAIFCFTYYTAVSAVAFFFKAFSCALVLCASG